MLNYSEYDAHQLALKLTSEAMEYGLISKKTDSTETAKQVLGFYNAIKSEFYSKD